MLVANGVNGVAVEATHSLEASTFTCPVCDGPVNLKRGRVRVPHFAHLPGADCWLASEPESVTHLRSKQLLAKEFRNLGYEVRPEETYRDAGRRVDVAVTLPWWRNFRIAVEVQDSTIDVETMKKRTRIDKFLGFAGTLWIFTDKRAAALMAVADGDTEVRIPNEMLWVDRRFEQGIFVLDLAEERVWNIKFGSPHVRNNSWYDQDGDEQYGSYTPRTLRCPVKWPAEFSLLSRPGRYPNERAIIFAPSPAPIPERFNLTDRDRAILEASPITDVARDLGVLLRGPVAKSETEPRGPVSPEGKHLREQLRSMSLAKLREPDDKGELYEGICPFCSRDAFSAYSSGQWSCSACLETGWNVAIFVCKVRDLFIMEAFEWLEQRQAPL